MLRCHLAPTDRLPRPTLCRDENTYSRFSALIDHVKLSTDLIERIVPHLEATVRALVSVVLPKVVRAPEGNSYSWAHGPTGINRRNLLNAGDTTP